MSDSPGADSTNPSGALPGDPRHGLSEEQLQAYYRESRSQLDCASNVSPSGVEPQIAASVMDEHLEYLRSTRDQIRFAGPSCWETTGRQRSAGIWLIDAEDRAGAEEWAAAEPFNEAAGLRFGDWSPAGPRACRSANGDYARTQGWKQFAITALDGLDGSERRLAVADAHHQFQATVMDRYVARGPMLTDDGSELIGSFMIVEFPDREACDGFWAAEPLNTGGVFSAVTIDSWRYGKALG